MDIRSRVLAARLSVRINENSSYSRALNIKDLSGFKKHPKEVKKNA